MHRAAQVRRRFDFGKVAEQAGKFAGSLMRTVPGAGGALSVIAGLWMIYHPLALLAAGAFLLIVDRRVP